ncbi:MAG TPA: ferritin-like domain-containing protein [Thermoanaerobaculia bacterium]|nr:ferritin-like domain-containing protein [Thermoanaerobaculia bacterium]
MIAAAATPAFRIGSAEHKDLLCSFFVETHDPYDPEALAWPDLPPDAVERLRALPIWEEAVRTEAQTAQAVLSMGEAEADPVLSKAISLQGYEEARHARILKLLTERYGIDVPVFEVDKPPDPNWAFMRIGYGECFDSFFAFGLFALARDSGFFPKSLVDLFEPIMQEEGRHILFHVNWVAYNQAQLPYAGRPGYVFKRGLAMWLQAVSRLKTALRVKSATDADQDNFTMKAHAQFADISPREFIELCLSENDRRLAPYDARLIRPQFVPKIARTLAAAMGRKSG